ncbi:unnamed protein product [Prorocentrum cordatum]|uniref:DNA (cytosine-5-)-methyltransferase n=1 Tax=Prorocentrum cordatum TaxID=2364126 RepID=A0ABN9SFE5_9DINO|nr:unnamed protein product [Polarella glacialis]
MNPLTIAEGGSQEPYNYGSFNSVLKKSNTDNNGAVSYDCGGNFFWQSFVWMANHRVPVNMGMVRDMQRMHLCPSSPPSKLPLTTVIAVDNATADIMENKGGMARISNPEPVFATILSLESAIRNKESDEVLMAWRKTLLSAPFSFEVVSPGEDRYWRAQNIRQQIIQTGFIAQLSVRQWIYDVVGLKLAMEKEMAKEIGSEKLHKLYTDKITFAGNQKPLSASFVDSAVTVYKRVLSLSQARRHLEWAEENMLDNYPFKTIGSLQALVDRGQTASRISWAIWGMTDLYRMESINIGEFSGKKLQDYRVSYVEVLNLKLALRDEFLQNWLPQSGIASQFATKLQEVLADFESVRKHMTAYPGSHADTTWMVSVPPSVAAAAEMIEDMVYTVNWDPRFRDAIKSKCTVTDFMAYDSVAGAIKEVTDMISVERAASMKCVENGGSETAGTAEGAAVPAAGSAVSAAPAAAEGFEILGTTEKEHWQQHVDKTVRTYINFIVEGKKSQAEIELAIKNSPLAMIQGDPTGLVLYFYDVKAHGEPLTRPELRISPLRDVVYNKLVKSVLNARAPAGGQPHLRPGEVAVVLDGGRRGNANKLQAPWREGTRKDGKKKEDDDEEDPVDDEDEEKPNFTVSNINLIYTESSLQARRQKARGCMGSVQQSETAIMMSNNKISIPERSRKHWPGSTSGDTIYGIEAPDISKEWKMAWKDKKDVLGKKHMIPVGGKTEMDNVDPSQIERKTDSTWVPMCYHPMPEKFYDELIYTFYAKSIVDLTPTDGKFAFTALKQRVGYVGIAYTDAHAEKLYDRLGELMKKEMLNPASKLWNSSYAKAVKPDTNAEEEIEVLAPNMLVQADRSCERRALTVQMRRNSTAAPSCESQFNGGTELREAKFNGGTELRVGSDFSGMDAFSAALKRMNVPHEVLFASDTNVTCRKVLHYVHNPHMIYGGIEEREADADPSTDLYLWTPPCQDFSSIGKGAGKNGPQRSGALMARAMKYIKMKQPRLTIMENVKALTHAKHRPAMAGILKFLQDNNYEVFKNVLNAKHYGLPQDRRRLIIVGIRKDCIKRPFSWPTINMKTPSVATILDRHLPSDKPGRLPSKAREKERCQAAYRKAHGDGHDARKVNIMVDVDASEKFQTFGVDICKTLTRSRGGCGGPWASTRGRRLTTPELLRLQGFKPEDCPYQELGISERQVGLMAGNAVAVNMAGVVLQEALWSAGLVKEKSVYPRMSHVVA